MTAWQQGVDVLGQSRGFNPARELRRVINPYKRSTISTVGRSFTAVLQSTERSVKVTDNAIMKMMRG